MSRHLHTDCETFSRADLKSVGAARYANDTSTEILTASFALGDEEPTPWWPGCAHDMEKYWDALEDPSVLVFAHHAQFEMFVFLALAEKTWGIPCPALSRFRCTMSLARRASLPSKLEKLAEVLRLTHQKDSRGKSLIRKFSIMQPPRKPTKAFPMGRPARRIRPEDEPEAFAEFVEYCRQDVRAEQEVYRRLRYFDDDINAANYSLDAVINARGVTVNLPALRHAQSLIEQETEIVSRQFRELTGFEVTQNARLLEWLHGEGVHLDNLQAETVDTFLADWESQQVIPPAVAALQMKQSIAYASIKKVKAMTMCAGPGDNRLRGLLSYHGASTGRWTSSTVQLQNFARPKIKDSEGAFEMICAGVSRDMIEICYGPVLEVVSSCIRHFIEGPFWDADYSAIEARIVNWLSGQGDALEEYRQGIDRYTEMAALIYRVPVKAVSKFPQRFIGKQTILGCSYGMGKSKFRGTCEKLGYKDMPAGLEDVAVDTFRSRHNKVVRFWKDLENAAKQAIVRKGSVFKAGEHISFLCKDIEGVPFLLMKLPSGRKLAYPRPKIVPHKRFEGQTAINFFGNIKGVIWGDVETWGGTFCENACQGVAFDIMANGTHNAERAGYETATLVHDQNLSYVKPNQSIEEFIRLLTELPPWAEGLPLAADGGRVPFYKKD